MSRPADGAPADRALRRLAAEARACTLCAEDFGFAPRPVFQVDRRAPVLLAGQAPGRRVHETGVPWNDPSGDRLRGWLGVDRETFYDPSRFAILPTGLCFPGTVPGKGDLPPAPRCAPTWHPRFMGLLAPRLRLRLYIGAYAVAYHRPELAGVPLAEAVARFEENARRGFLVLPHPSPRNQRWLRDRPWFEAKVVPRLRRLVRSALAGG